MARTTTAAKELHKEANELFKSGDYGAAAEAYTAALQQVPASQPGAEDLDPAAAKSKALEVTLLSNRAECYLRLGELAPAQLDVDRALSLDPQHAKSLKRRARAAEQRHAKELAKAQAMAARNIRMHEAVMQAQEQLIDGVESAAQLEALGQQINAPHFAEVVEERVHSLGLCGYPTCRRPVAKAKAGKLVLSPAKGQIFETVQPLYCSAQCKRCAQDFVSTLPEAPVVIAADKTPVDEAEEAAPEAPPRRDEESRPQRQQDGMDQEEAVAV